MNQTWKWRPLGELFEIGAGKAMSAAARNGPNKTPFLRTSNVLWDEINLASVDEMSIPEHELPRRLLRRGDLLVCEGGEIGRAAIWDGQVETMSFQNHLHRLRPAVPDVEPRFYVFFLLSAFTQLGIYEGAGNRTTIPNLSRSHLARLEVPHPPIGEQQAISATLGRVRDAIQAQVRSTKVVQELRHATTRTLFTSGLGCEPQRATTIGPLPQSWETVPIASVATVKGGKRMPKGVSLTNENTGQPYIRITDFRDHGIRAEQVLFVPRDHQSAIARYIVSSEDVCISIAGTIGLIVQVPSEFHGANLTENAAKISITDAEVLPRYLMYALASEACQAQIAQSTATNAQPKLALVRLEQVLVPVPSTLKEQREVVAILDAISRKVARQRYRRIVLEELFRAVLQGTMTGTIQMKELETLVIKES